MSAWASDAEGEAAGNEAEPVRSAVPKREKKAHKNSYSVRPALARLAAIRRQLNGTSDPISNYGCRPATINTGASSILHPTDLSQQSKEPLLVVVESHPSTDSLTSVPQRTTTLPLGVVNTTVESFNLSENIVHGSAMAALCRFGDAHEYSKCQCSKVCGEICTNKACLLACDEKTCGVEKDRCQNRWVEKLGDSKPPVIVIEAGGFGWGLSSNRLICEGEMRVEYTGEVISEAEKNLRETESYRKAYQEKHEKEALATLYLMQAAPDANQIAS
ncbi:hypothetical protein FDECE_9036 [Fusarium decemcellulare]|nr:hypothetical protein FDECE_9036 [Fusarium decemcellulare]